MTEYPLNKNCEGYSDPTAFKVLSNSNDPKPGEIWTRTNKYQETERYLILRAHNNGLVNCFQIRETTKTFEGEPEYMILGSSLYFLDSLTKRCCYSFVNTDYILTKQIKFLNVDWDGGHVGESVLAELQRQVAYSLGLHDFLEEPAEREYYEAELESIMDDGFEDYDEELEFELLKQRANIFENVLYTLLTGKREE